MYFLRPRRRYHLPSYDSQNGEITQSFCESKRSIPDPVEEAQKISKNHLRPSIADDEPTTDWIPEIPFQNVRDCSLLPMHSVYSHLACLFHPS